MNVIDFNHNKTIYTHSELQCAKDCLQKWQYRYKLGWRPAKTPVSISFGSAMHNALEAYYNGGDYNIGTKVIDHTFDSFLANCSDEDAQEAYIKASSDAKQVFGHYLQCWR